MSGHLCLKWNNHSSAFNKILSKLYLEDTYSDATLLCEGKSYPVHRLVMSTCSQYFEEVFKQCANINNKHPFIIVKDVQSEQLEALLNYMYKGEVNVPQEVLPELIKAAEIFQIRGLAVPDEEDESSSSKPSRKRSSTQSSSTSPSAKKSCKQKDRGSDLSSNNEIYNENTSVASPVYIDEEPKPQIKAEPEEIFPVEVINDNSENSVKDEDYSNFSESTDFTNTGIDTSVTDNFEPTQSTSWDNSQGFAEGESQENLDRMPVLKIKPEPEEIFPVEIIDEHSVKDESFSIFAENTNFIDNNTTESFEPSQGDLHMADNPRKNIDAQKKKYLCNFCNHKAESKRHITRHEMIHTGVKPYVCHLCDYKSNQMAPLKTHMLTHTGEKPFACPHCDYKSARKTHMKSHAFAKHRHIFNPKQY